MSLSPLVLAEGPAVNLAHQDLLSGRLFSSIGIHPDQLLPRQISNTKTRGL